MGEDMEGIGPGLI